MKLKIRAHTMLKNKHSWSISVTEILKQLHIMGHDLYIVSTDGYPDDCDVLKKYFGRNCDDPHIDFCYTLPGNWKDRFSKNSKIKASIFNYETSIVPKEWKYETKYLDYVLPSSNFSKEIFLKNGWDEKKLHLLPLGYDKDSFLDKNIYDVRGARKFKFLTVAINHYRKNLDKLIRAYYKSFSDEDDVSLILKTNLSNPKTKFEFHVISMINLIQKEFGGKKLPNLILLDDKIDNMATLYNLCDVFISASSSEGFGLPFLESMAANKLIIAPRATGQLDFLDDKNCLFLNMSEVIADQNVQYWRADKLGKTWSPDISDISEKMIFAHKNSDVLLENFSKNFDDVLEKYTWNNTAKKLVSLYDNL
jgi:glycosyltransferase involved in cell wall biosynthesis